MTEPRKMMPAITPGDDVDGIAFRKYMQVLLNRRWLVLGCIALCLGAMAIWTYTRQRMYAATVSLIVERQAPQVLGRKVSEVVELAPHNQEYMATQVNLACSKTTAKLVAEKLGLHRIQRFWPPVEKKGAAVPVRHTPEAAAGTLLGMMACRTRVGTNIIEVTVQHWDPNMASRLANAAGKEFMDSVVAFKLDSTKGAVRWLAKELDGLKSTLENAELALFNYKKGHDFIAMDLSDQTMFLATQVRRVNHAVVTAQLDRIRVGVQLPELKAAQKNPLTLGNLPLFATALINQLRGRLFDLTTTYSELRAVYLEDHPKVRQVTARIEKVKAQLEEEIRSIVVGMEAEYVQATRHENHLMAKLREVKEKAFDVNSKELAYRQLERNSENAAKVYGLVLNRMKENDLISNLHVNNIRLMDAAEPSFAPVSPRVKLNLLIGGMLGLLLGIGLAFLFAFLDNTVKSLEDAESVNGLVCLGFIPSIPALQTKDGVAEPRELCVHRMPSSATAESCRSIRTNLLFSSPDRKLKKIVVTSPGPEEGKTTTAVSLAVTMAQGGNRVLLID
ncbi:MAG: exopolysaccharide transport family protein, partial [Pseudomonadota bacterium]